MPTNPVTECKADFVFVCTCAEPLVSADMTLPGVLCDVCLNHICNYCCCFKVRTEISPFFLFALFFLFGI